MGGGEGRSPAAALEGRVPIASGLAPYVKFEAAAWAVEARPPPSAWRQHPVYDGYPRARVPLTLVANTPLRIPPSPFIKTVQVPRGFNVADERIAEHVCNRAT